MKQFKIGIIFSILVVLILLTLMFIVTQYVWLSIFGLVLSSGCVYWMYYVVDFNAKNNIA